MMDNITCLNQFLNQGKIMLESAPFLQTQPPPLPEGWDFERVEGMLLGLAVGDSLGATSESMSPAQRNARYGEIKDYLPNHYAGGRKVGVADDDSQMTFWTLEQLLEAGRLVPDDLAQKFSQHEIYGIGISVSNFVRKYQSGLPWDEATQHSAGNGALMRIAPVVIPHLRQPSPALWADAAIAGMVTHNDRASNACCISFVNLLWECLRMSQPPTPEWWVDTFVEVAKWLEGDESSYTSNSPKTPYNGPLWKFVDQQVRRALDENLTVVEACNRWYSSAYLLETMPSVLYILARHAQDAEEAILRAVNDTWDNDSVAAIVGAAVGALHGRKGLPARWVKDLLGRTTADDDWHAFELIEAARQKFWKADPPITKENLEAVVKFLPIFEQPDFKPGEWVSYEGALPYFEYSKAVEAFHTALGQNNFLQPFDWPQWVECQQLIDRPELVDRASLQTLRKLLTAHIRADRFTEGHLAAMFETGQIVRILRRLVEITNSKNPGS